MLFCQILSAFLGMSVVVGAEGTSVQQIPWELGVQARDDITESFLVNSRTHSVGHILDSFEGKAAVVPLDAEMHVFQGRGDSEGPIHQSGGPLGVQSPWIDKLENKFISIFKRALDKEFLIRFNTITPGPVSTFTNGASRVVVFKKINEKLFLLEATDGHMINQDVPLSLILAEFPIIKEDDGVITFDFNAGMSQHFSYSSSWHASDYVTVGLLSHFAALDVQFSYVDEAALSKNNQLFIRQVAQVKSGNIRVPLEVRYIIAPYKANPNFKVTQAGEFDEVGFFEVAPRYNKYGIQDIYATKFDLTKPIIFALSANTPSDYRQAVRDGVLYWNQAFDGDVVSVVDVPEGVSAPHPDFNIIQWVNWNDAGMAYADAQHDPRTGEVLNAQIWLSSVFAASGKKRAKRLLKVLESHKPSTLTALGIKGFEKKALCSFQFTRQGSEGVGEVAKLEDEEKIYEISTDFVRSVVAHEVGHVLGLRHNFAGSLGINYTREERQRYFKNYLKDLKVPSTVVPGNSIMDYNAYEESVFMGNRMRVGQEKLLDYDKMAIHHLYVKGVEGSTKGSSKMPSSDFNEYNRPLFCTDSHRLDFVDCDIFDVFASPVEEAVHTLNNRVRNLPGRILERFARAKDPSAGKHPWPLEKVSLSPSSEAIYLFSGQRKLLEILTTKGAMLRVTRSFKNVDELNKKRVNQMTNELIYQDVQNHGGANKVLAFLPEDFVEEQSLRFSQILEKSYRKGMGPGGQGYEFDEDEVEFITKQAHLFYTLLKEEADKVYLESFIKMKGIRDTQLSMDLAKFFLEKSRHYLMDTTSSVIPGSLKKEKAYIPVDVPKFVYKFGTRKLSTKLLSNPSRSENLFWGKQEKKQLKKEYENFLNEIFEGKKFRSLKEEDISPDLLPWYWEQRKLLLLL